MQSRVGAALVATLGQGFGHVHIRGSHLGILGSQASNPKPNKDWRVKQSLFDTNRRKPPVIRHRECNDEQFEKAATFESQMQALSSRGFRRPYRPYQPPQDLEPRFLAVCDRLLTAEDGWIPTGGPPQSQPDMAKVKLTGISKQRLLTEMAAEFKGHWVPNSLLHTITSLDRLLDFYKVPVSKATPYDLLASKRPQLGAKGEPPLLPPNLYVQPEPVRFDPQQAEADGNRQRVATVTAFPKSSTILVSPESRKRYREVKAAASPWRNSPLD